MNNTLTTKIVGTPDAAKRHAWKRFFFVQQPDGKYALGHFWSLLIIVVIVALVARGILADTVAWRVENLPAWASTTQEKSAHSDVLNIQRLVIRTGQTFMQGGIPTAHVMPVDQAVAVFAGAKPISQVPWVTDAKGCVYALIESGKGVSVEPMLRFANTPLCAEWDSERAAK